MITRPDALRQIIDWAIENSQSQITGTVVSDPYEISDLAGNTTWACDVDIGGEEVLQGVAIAVNNFDISFAQPGRAVTLSRLNNGKWVVTGLAKDIKSTIQVTYLTFTEDAYEIVSTQLRGFIYRLLTYSELGTLVEPLGYGTVPYGARGKFDAAGNFIEIVEAP